LLLIGIGSVVGQGKLLELKQTVFPIAEKELELLLWDCSIDVGILF
jgi:hypothetical protein